MIRLEAQLDGSRTESIDCGVASTVMAIDYASGGKLRTTTERVRGRMNVDDTTTPWDWQRATREFRPQMRKLGLRPMRTTIADGADFARLKTILFKARRPVIVALDYGTVADQAPHLWSSTSFRGGHAVFLRVGSERGGVPMVRVLDPLADGRPVAGRRVVKGPRWWPWSLVKAACGNIRNPDGTLLYPKRDRWIGLVVWRSQAIEPKDPEEPDVEPPIDDEGEEPDEPAEDALETLTDVAGDIDDAIQALRASPDAGGIAAAMKAMRAARDSIEPLMPPGSKSKGDSRGGFDARPRPPG